MLKQLYILGIAVYISSCGGGGDSESQSASCTEDGYYIDATNGDDGSSGTSSCSPWQSFDRVSEIPNDSTLFLRRNQEWNEGLTLSSSNISITSYGAGDAPLLSGYRPQNTWVQDDTGRFRATMTLNDGEGLGHVRINGEVAQFYPWITNAATSLNDASEGSFTIDFDTNTVYITANTPPIDGSIEVSTVYRGVYAPDLRDILIEGLTIEGFSLHGIELRNCVNCSVTDTTIQDIGGAVIFDGNSNPVYAGNGIEFTNSAQNGSVHNTAIQDVFDSCISPQTYLANQVLNNMRFENLTLSACGFAGVEISVLDNGGSSNSSITNVDIENVNISSTGKGWSGQRYGTEGYGIRIQADDGAGYINQTSITGSSIENAINNGIHITGDTRRTEITQTLIASNDSVGIAITSPTSTTPDALVSTSLIRDNAGWGLLYNCSNCTGLTVQHTTFYQNTPIQLGLINHSQGIDIRNNLFGGSGITHLYSQSAINGDVINHNCYRNHTAMIGYDGTAYDGLSGFQASTDHDADSIDTSNTGLSGASSEDFRPESASDCIGIGDSGLSIRNDFYGAPFATPPAAGAFSPSP